MERIWAGNEKLHMAPKNMKRNNGTNRWLWACMYCTHWAF